MIISSTDSHNYLISFYRSYFILPCMWVTTYVCLYYPLDSRALRIEQLNYYASQPGPMIMLQGYQYSVRVCQGRKSCSEKLSLLFNSFRCARTHTRTHMFVLEVQSILHSTKNTGFEAYGTCLQILALLERSYLILGQLNQCVLNSSSVTLWD